MTTTTSSTRTKIEHRFEVPAGSAFSDLSVAIHWASLKAAELGINTDYDDWCSVESDGDRVVLVVVETREGPGDNPPPTVGRKKRHKKAHQRA